MEKRNILIVDDDEYNLRLMASIFGNDDINLCYAMSGEEAVGILKECCFSTMITDLNMPGTPLPRSCDG
jgi:CheY-like chemotaxis protein